ncbi:hypothetical protein LBMAG42_26380 [Deltaproteobacteria bacterium]|nr:hypothetical protein LBMAG42_26380 [Deltaproteobacteria bacterium]
MWFIFLAFAHAADGTVSIPLDQWVQMLDQAAAAADKPAAPAPYLQVDRSIEGSFQRGVFSGVLTTRIRVLDAGGGLLVPVLSDAASIASVELDGKRTSLLADSGNYRVAIDSVGEHTVRVAFFVGQEDDRFARRLTLSFPPAGPTAVSIVVPEVGITADLAHGAVTSQRIEGATTRILGQLDGEGALDLGWKGTVATNTVAARTEVREHVVFTLHEALVRGVAAFDTRVLEGEVDRLRFRVPPGVEIVDVEGESVLQWRTDAGELVVYNRWLVNDKADIKVHFQLPVQAGAPLTLAMPLPLDGAPFAGAVGVQGPAGFSATVLSIAGAEPIRDLPPELAALTPNPLLLGFTLSGEPAITLDVKREADVSLTTTSIDEMEAATVLIEDGAQVTRMQLHVRNETRPWLGVRLPDDAVLTHARVDGRAVRPATAPDGVTLLLPLPQSERYTAGQSQTWTVRDGDTLGALADRFYGDPSRWQEIVAQNYDVFSNGLGELNVGQVLHVAPVEAGGVAASRAVIELAWTQAGDPMRSLGHRSLTLPGVDAEVGSVEWHVYVPSAFYALDLGGNLAPWSHLRYDHFRRVQQFFDAALGIHSAWAGSDVQGGYSSILSRRKSIFADETSSSVELQEVASVFPLVGDRHRFRRMMPSDAAPALTVTWMDAKGLIPLRFAGLAAGAALATAWAGGRTRKPLLVAGIVASLLVAWYVDGVHRRLVWGADLGLAALWLRSEWSRMRGLWRGTTPTFGELLDAWTLRRVVLLGLAGGALMLLLTVPLLWSTLALVVLAWRARRSA